MSDNQTMNDEWDQLMSDLLKYAENLQVDDENYVEEPKKYTKIADLLKQKSENSPKETQKMNKTVKKKPEIEQKQTTKQRKIIKKRLKTIHQYPQTIILYHQLI